MADAVSIKVEQVTDNNTLNVVLDTINRSRQALVFVNTKRSAEKCAEDASKKITKSDDALETVAKEILKAVSKPTRQCERLARCVRKGVSFHHAGLTYKQREVIENNFRLGNIKIICCTPTLAAGVDLPAFRTIIRDLKRFSSSGWAGMQYIPVLEYLQMAGRAGRPKFDTFGEAICVAANSDEKLKIWDKYLLGEPEEIFSKLAVEPVLRTYILSLIATGFVSSKKDIIDFFSKTFWAHQFKDMDKLEFSINKMIDLLHDYEFILTKTRSDLKSDFTSASEIKENPNNPIRPTMLGMRVAQLYLDPLTAHHIIKCIRRSGDVPLTSFSLLQAICNTLEMRPLLRVKTKEFDSLNEQFVRFEHAILQKQPSIYEPEYDDFLASIKTAFFMRDWINEKDEDYLYKEYDIRPGEIRAKLERAQWLLYSAEELSKLMSFHSILKDITKVKFRLKYGVKEELIPLLRLKSIGRVRARKMYNAGIHDLGAVKKADITTLSQLIGKATANNIKDQVGEELDKLKISARKRKGQMSVMKY